MTFRELNLKDEILSAIEELGYEQPMPVQEKTIPFMLEQTADLVALAQTGTGKTAAFGLPVLNMIDANRKQVQALVLSPTRELCIQIANDLKGYSKNMRGMRIVPVYGGEDIRTQLRQLDTAPQIIVATPGRLIDLIERGKIELGAIDFLVLDEADEMLNMGFKEDIETILERTPDTRRTMLFSATMPKEIANIAKRYMKNYEEITVGTKNAGAENVEHIYYVSQARQRYMVLKRIVDLNPDIYGIVFCRTRQETKEVADKLMHDGYSADALHGDLSQAQRDTVMQKFRIRNIQLLVATDVAARGLDVSDLTHVINYNLPDDVEIYTHRSGRTGRANKKGIAVSIIHSKERFKIKDIERMLRKNFIQEQIPNGLEVCKKQLFFMIDRMQNVEVSEEQIEQYVPQIMKQLESLSKEEILKRFVSIEFNRFLSYYKNAEDLNLPEHSTRERGERGDRNDRGERGERGAKSGGRVRLKMNIGEREGVDPKRLLGIINDVTGDKSINIGSIEVTNKFTFFDVFADQLDQVVTAFAGQSEVEVSEAKGSKTFEGGGSRKPEYRSRGSYGGGESRSGGGYRGGERSSDRGADRGPRPAASTGGEKPWRNRDLGDRSSRPSGGSSDRRSSGSAGYKGGSSSYKKR
ncbi:MAG: DEAD/DEAH box helicase [Paludibacter sp.]|nr:DEAD/DEAH box helicase [Paludibacter sp.]